MCPQRSLGLPILLLDPEQRLELLFLLRAQCDKGLVLHLVDVGESMDERCNRQGFIAVLMGNDNDLTSLSKFRHQC